MAVATRAIVAAGSTVIVAPKRPRGGLPRATLDRRRFDRDRLGGQVASGSPGFTSRRIRSGRSVATEPHGHAIRWPPLHHALRCLD